MVIFGEIEKRMVKLGKRGGGGVEECDVGVGGINFGGGGRILKELKKMMVMRVEV